MCILHKTRLQISSEGTSNVSGGSLRLASMCFLCVAYVGRDGFYTAKSVAMNDKEEAQGNLYYTLLLLLPQGHRYHKIVIVIKGIECSSEMETIYFAGTRDIYFTF